MDELIVRSLSGVATDIELRRLERWRRESEANERRFAELEALWSLTSRVVEGRDASTGPPDVGVITAQAEARRRRARRLRALRSPWIAYPTAAVALVATLWLGATRAPDLRPDRIAPVESTATADDVLTMSLSDGSVVRLAGSTTVEFPPAAHERSVVVAGRAFFAVAPSELPFVVHTSAGSVSVFGTRFEVAVDGDELRVVVVEGRVAVRVGDESVDVEAGRVARAGGGGPPTVQLVGDVWTLLDWEGGLLVFQETPLAAVAAEIGRHFGVRVEVDEALNGRRVTAWFADESLEEIVEAVCLVTGAECSSSGDVVRVGT